MFYIMPNKDYISLVFTVAYDVQFMRQSKVSQEISTSYMVFTKY